MSKVESLTRVVEAGGHVMGANGLAAYHAARAVRDGLRAHDYFIRARQALKNWNVRVELASEGGKLTISTFNRSHQVTV